MVSMIAVSAFLTLQISTVTRHYNGVAVIGMGRWGRQARWGWSGF